MITASATGSTTVAMTESSTPRSYWRAPESE